MTILVQDTTQTSTVSASDPFFKIRKQGDIAVLRSTNLDGSAVISLYYESPDGKVNNPSTFRDGPEAGSQVTLTPTYPEAIINVPGKYRVAVTAAATTAGIIYTEE